MQYEVCLEMLEVGFEDGSAVWCGDVRDECNDVRDGSDGIKIDTWWSEDDELLACFGGVERSLQDNFFRYRHTHQQSDHLWACTFLLPVANLLERHRDR